MAIVRDVDYTGERYIKPRYRKYSTPRHNELMITLGVLRQVKAELDAGDQDGWAHLQAMIARVEKVSERIYNAGPKR